MFYFIPSWYQGYQWSENEQSWYVRRMHTEFDDTVKQIQLFHRNGTHPYRILNLSFSPNFRHFLHRQSVYHAPYWSCFDAIQEIDTQKMRVFSIYDLQWPDDVEFIRTNFVLVAYRFGEKYAIVEHGEDGNPIRIKIYAQGKINRRNIYDDRGFVSATILYKDERPIYQDYLMKNGVRKMRVFFSDGHVEINSDAPFYLLQNGKTKKRVPFLKLQYDGIEQVISEVFSAYVKMTRSEDLFCVALHDLHTKMLLDILKDRKLILSVFQDRYYFEENKDLFEDILKANYIIADSEERVAKIEELFEGRLKNITDITPFDTRMDTGISQQLSVQKILFAVDQMKDELFQDIIVQMAEYIPTNKHARVCLFTRDADYNRPKQLLEQTRRILAENGYPEGWAAESVSTDTENTVDDESEEKTIPVKFYVDQCVEELAVSRCMKEQRVLVDLHPVPELYLQIQAVSLGLPQIVGVENHFAEHEGNAIVLKQISELPEALGHYLDGLENWNQAQVYSHQLGKKYTTAVLLDKWKEVIESIG